MCLVDSFITVLDKYENKSFTLINVNNGKAARICPVGQGPGEIINPSKNVNILKKEGKTCLYVYDSFLSKILVYDLDSVLKNNETPAFDFILLKPASKSTGITTIIQMINDSLWIGTGVYLNGVFSFFKHGIRGKEMVDLFIDDFPVSPFERAFREFPFFKVSHDKSYVVRSAHIAGIIEVYSIDGDTLQNKFSHKYFKQECKVIDYNTIISSDKTRNGYLDVAVSSDKVYGLYSGKLDKEPNYFQSQYIHIYDFDGNLLEILILDTPVCAIDIDNTGDVIYAIAAEGDRRILSFNINKK
jgi:hypothetical protein